LSRQKQNKKQVVAAPANDGLDGAWGGLQSLEVLKRGAFTWSSLTWFQSVGGADKKRALVLP